MIGAITILRSLSAFVLVLLVLRLSELVPLSEDGGAIVSPLASLPCVAVEKLEATPGQLLVYCAGEALPREISVPVGYTLRLSQWDASAVVYVAAGADAMPGAAEVDDDGNGLVDDLRELGATGSDDVMLTPLDQGYDDARQGRVTAMAISRGAMIPTPSPSPILAPDATTISAPAHVRIDLIDDRQRLVSRIVDL
jgi:hypothetical protein